MSSLVSTENNLDKKCYLYSSSYSITQQMCLIFIICWYLLTLLYSICCKVSIDIIKKSSVSALKHLCVVNSVNIFWLF